MNVLNFPHAQQQPDIDELGLIVSGESERGGHQLEIAGACGRKWALKHALGIPRVECPSLDNKTPAWQLGTLVHQGIANYLAVTMMCDKVTSPVNAITIRAEQLGASEAAVEQANELVIKYMNYVEEQHPEWVCMAIEPQLVCDFGDGLGLFTVGADAVFWDRKNLEPVIVDWKTAGRIQSNSNYKYSNQYTRYRMVLRTVARANDKPDGWGKVIIGLIPTGKTNFPKRNLIEAPYFPFPVSGVEQQTADGLALLTFMENQDPHALVYAGASYGPECNGVYSPCPYRDSHCFIG